MRIIHRKSMVKTEEHEAVQTVGSSGEDLHPYLKDAWIAIVIGILLFNIPKENPLAGGFLWNAPPGIILHMYLLRHSFVYRIGFMS